MEKKTQYLTQITNLIHSLLGYFIKKNEVHNISNDLGNEIVDDGGLYCSKTKKKSYVGMILHTTSLDTLKKVSELYEGEWEQMSNGFLIGSSEKYEIGSKGGANNINITSENLPSHTHNILTSKMSITLSGVGDHSHSYTDVNNAGNSASGSTYNRVTAYSSGNTSWGGDHNHSLSFSGSTNYFGNSDCLLNIKNYCYNVYTWRRIS